MGLRKMMMVMMGLTVVAVALSATVEARGGGFDANTMLAHMFNDNGEPNFEIKSTTTACCDKCFCTKSIPPQCHCNDIAETCHSACKFCICTRSYPPQCRCTDTTTFCYPPCSSASAKPQIAQA